MKNWRKTLGWVLQIGSVLIAIINLTSKNSSLLYLETNALIFRVVLLVGMFFIGKRLKKQSLYYCNHCGTKGTYSSYRESDPRVEVEKTKIEDSDISYVSDVWISVATSTTYNCPKCGSSWNLTGRKKA